MKKVIQPDYAYVEARNKLIPQAERIARSRSSYPGRKTSFAKEFNIAMTELAIAAGLMEPGNLVLLNAKEIPFSKGYFK